VPVGVAVVVCPLLVAVVRVIRALLLLLLPTTLVVVVLRVRAWGAQAVRGGVVCACLCAQPGPCCACDCADRAACANPGAVRVSAPLITHHVLSRVLVGHGLAVAQVQLLVLRVVLAGARRGPVVAHRDLLRLSAATRAAGWVRQATGQVGRLLLLLAW
jgi:hypothetical protein